MGKRAKVIWNGRVIDLAASAQPVAPARTTWEWGLAGGIAAAAVVILAIAATALPPIVGCNIKGNVSLEGERIYHVPGQGYYQKTWISYIRGERWFCSEDDARQAGWRRARR